MDLTCIKIISSIIGVDCILGFCIYRCETNKNNIGIPSEIPIISIEQYESSRKLIDQQTTHTDPPTYYHVYDISEPPTYIDSIINRP